MKNTSRGAVPVAGVFSGAKFGSIAYICTAAISDIRGAAAGRLSWVAPPQYHGASSRRSLPMMKVSLIRAENDRLIVILKRPQLIVNLRLTLTPASIVTMDLR